MIEEFKNEGAEIVGISKDSQKSHINFTEKHDIKITLLSDPEKNVLESYGAWGEKKMFGISRMGTIRSTFIIDPEGKLVYKWKNVKVKEHVEKVFAKLLKLKDK